MRISTIVALSPVSSNNCWARLFRGDTDNTKLSSTNLFGKERCEDRLGELSHREPFRVRRRMESSQYGTEAIQIWQV